METGDVSSIEMQQVSDLKNQTLVSTNRWCDWFLNPNSSGSYPQSSTGTTTITLTLVRLAQSWRLERTDTCTTWPGPHTGFMSPAVIDLAYRLILVFGCCSFRRSKLLFIYFKKYDICYILKSPDFLLSVSRKTYITVHGQSQQGLFAHLGHAAPTPRSKVKQSVLSWWSSLSQICFFWFSRFPFVSNKNPSLLVVFLLQTLTNKKKKRGGGDCAITQISIWGAITEESTTLHSRE